MARTSRVIAIVDDDPSVLKALARLLSARSFVARTFQSAPQFLASLPAGQPDCLIADLQMPEMTGLELQQNLISKGIVIPTIIITAHDEAGMHERCRSAGAIAYLSKPVHDTLLFAAIDAAGSTGS
jgi:FixJ family two-component response regulator